MLVFGNRRSVGCIPNTLYIPLVARINLAAFLILAYFNSMLKRVIYVLALLGILWGAFFTLYISAVAMLAPLAVRGDSAEMRNIFLLAASAWLFIGTYGILWVRGVFGRIKNPKLSLIIGTAGVILVPIAQALNGLELSQLLISFAVPLICWAIFARYLLSLPPQSA